MDKLKTITQSNTITSGRYDYTSTQLDILFILIGNINKDDQQGKEYIINMKDAQAITERKYNYKQIYDNITKLGSRDFIIKNDKDKTEQIWLFSKITYYHGEGKLGIIINDTSKHLFLELKNNFTVIPLKAMLTLNSKYSKRIYALALQWKSIGSKTYKIEELKEILGCEKQFEEIFAFKNKVLEIAKKEINEKTDLEIDYELIKKGRKFEEIKIKLYKSKVSQRKEIDFKKEIKDQVKESLYIQRIKEITQIGINENYARVLAEPKNYNHYKSEKEKLLEEIKKGKKIENWLGYLIKIFQAQNIIPRL